MFFFSRKTPIAIPRPIYEEMISHARDEYPRMCCGVLVGTPLNRVVFESHRIVNLYKKEGNDRYGIDPKEMNIIKRSAVIQSLDILGFYHSHPDQPADPTQYDREMGQPGFSHVIISINRGMDISVKSWSFSKENEPFKEEGIKVKEQ